MIIPVYQPLGSSSHRLAADIGAQRQEKATHTGTLDPMAEGVLVVLTGEDRFQKSVYSKWPKVYEFSILWGLTTDTDDSLGLLTASPASWHKLPPTNHLAKQLQTLLPKFLGEQEQQVHAFSARRWQGQSSFDFARRGEPIPKKNSHYFTLVLCTHPYRYAPFGNHQ
ncbi:hypothetical protein LRY58_02585 [Candidatus Woesebacteria bacterium]|nr:hypothetical protein [Candidatus Woesebacteria bacterium]